jgi:hypothetical protein
MSTSLPSPAIRQTAPPAAWWLRVAPSVAVHAAVFLVVMSGGHVIHRAHVVPKDQHVITRTTMTMMAWIPSAPSEPLKAVVRERVVMVHSRKIVPAMTVRVNPEPAEITSSRPDKQPVSVDALALFRPPPPVPAPSDENVSVLFVGVENGEWLRWLTERHGFIGFTTRRDDVVEHVYSVSGDLLSTSSVTPADWWALEINLPDRVPAIADMLARERERAGDSNSRIRIFALFPASFRDEVTSAIHRTGGTGGVFLVSFSGDELHVAVSTPASQPTH